MSKTTDAIAIARDPETGEWVALVRKGRRRFLLYMVKPGLTYPQKTENGEPSSPTRVPPRKQRT